MSISLFLCPFSQYKSAPKKPAGFGGFPGTKKKSCLRFHQGQPVFWPHIRIYNRILLNFTQSIQEFPIEFLPQSPNFVNFTYSTFFFRGKEQIISPAQGKIPIGIFSFTQSLQCRVEITIGFFFRSNEKSSL